jgi:hypothetical protein
MLLAKYPPGLTSLLDLKVGGRAPDDFASTLIPTLEVGQFYRVNQRQLLASDVNVTNQGDTNFTNVSNGKTWLVEAISVTVAMAIGDTQLSGRIYAAPNAGTGFRVSLGNIRHVQGALAAAANWTVEGNLNGGAPLLLAPGTEIGFILDAALPGARLSALRILLSAFDI